MDFEEGTRLGQFCMLCECIRQRIRILARERRDILKLMEEIGLIMPLPPVLDAMDPDDIDPVAAWYEWVEFARTCDDE